MTWDDSGNWLLGELEIYQVQVAIFFEQKKPRSKLKRKGISNFSKQAQHLQSYGIFPPLAHPPRGFPLRMDDGHRRRTPLVPRIRRTWLRRGRTSPLIGRILPSILFLRLGQRKHETIRKNVSLIWRYACFWMNDAVLLLLLLDSKASEPEPMACQTSAPCRCGTSLRWLLIRDQLKAGMWFEVPFTGCFYLLLALLLVFLLGILIELFVFTRIFRYF